jgi:1,3-beta-galactosyl-N-acetylhexosamine phosphorylase
MHSNKQRNGGLVTLPAEADQEKVVLELTQKWGADAIRDSDGTRLSPELLQLGYEIYSTICLVRADQDWARQHRDKLPQKFLMSMPVTATAETVEIDLLESYFAEKYEIDKNHDPKKWWEVIDRTSGQVVEICDWEFAGDAGKVIINNAKKLHVYTVNFLVYQIWDSTSMYNHLVNKWTCEHIVSVEPYHPQVRQHLMEYFDRWLEEHPHTDVVRLTTLAYHFVLDSDRYGQDKYRDWLGYVDTISPAALEDFARQKGYRLRSEDFVDEGYYNATYRVPSERYLDWMDFIHHFVVDFGKDLVERIHKAGKKAAIFWGDHWIGVEPYSPLFQEMKVDINIGACEDGVALRRLADSPGPQLKEIRLYPYFFPDVFRPGGNPLAESISNWVKIRRALLRKPVDRIGYGGYLSLAAKFPDFVQHVTELCSEFRTILAHAQKTLPYTAPIKVAVLSCWGKLRSWLNNIGREEKFHVKRPDVTEIAGSNLLECLAGLCVDIEFISFRDILEKGIPDDVNVIINDGQPGSAWSGGRYWANEKIVTTIREWIYRGGGFIGVCGPSAYQQQGRFFQLADVMGVDKEIGNSCLVAPIKYQLLQKHFITDDAFESLNFGTETSWVYTWNEKVQVLADAPNRHVLVAASTFGNGRSLYLAQLPYSLQNSRLLHRALFWVSRNEDQLKKWFSLNLNTDCAAYPEPGFFVVVNNVPIQQQSVIYDEKGLGREVLLESYESKWFRI